jgi:hypothetical protein
VVDEIPAYDLPYTVCKVCQLETRRKPHLISRRDKPAASKLCCTCWCGLLTRSLLPTLQSKCQLGSTLLSPDFQILPTAQQYKLFPVVRAKTMDPWTASLRHGEKPMTLMAPLLCRQLRIERSLRTFQPVVYSYLKTFTPFSPSPPTAMLASAPLPLPICIIATDLGVQVWFWLMGRSSIWLRVRSLLVWYSPYTRSRSWVTTARMSSDNATARMRSCLDSDGTVKVRFGAMFRLRFAPSALYNRMSFGEHAATHPDGETDIAISCAFEKSCPCHWRRVSDCETNEADENTGKPSAAIDERRAEG